LKDIFPDMHFKSMSNLSNMFSPSFTRVMFVRHPFERLASAYKERIAILEKDRIQPEPHYTAVRKTICRRYTRFNSTHNPLWGRHPCEEFIPPFEHFVQYILMTAATPIGVARMDAHWQPYTVVCQVCSFKYNYIGKYETFNDDFTFLLKRLNVSDWNNQKRRGASGHTTRDYQQLFSSLPDDLICRLKRIYIDDFRLFNYRIEDYVNRTTVVCPS
jgi:chondroitin 4-sulfotransferase 11